MKIDLHVHTKERSSCGASSEAEQILAAIDAGLDAIAFSDHDRLAPVARLQGLNAKYAPFRVFGGIEVSIRNSPAELDFEHVLVLGVHDPRLENGRWSYPDLYKFVRQHDGFLAIAHPFRFHPYVAVDLERFPPDAIEAYSNNITDALRESIVPLIDKLGLPMLSNSDAHHKNFIGGFYNQLARPPADERELIEMLKAGQFTCVSPQNS